MSLFEIRNARKKYVFSNVQYYIFLRRVGGEVFNVVSQPMVSRYIAKYSEIITTHLAPRYTRFPQSVIEINTTKQKFMLKYNFPGILGVIDGTHVSISALPKAIERAFVNRKGTHSINVQIVCNSDMVITNINARYPGSTHDSFVYNNSQVYTFLENLYHERPNEWNWLIGETNKKNSCIFA